MAKEILIGKGWSQKIIRIRNNYSILADFIIFLGRNKDSEIRKIWNYVLGSGLDIFIEYNKKNTDLIQVIKYHGDREPRGFLLQVDTIEKIENEYKKYKPIYRNKYDILLSRGVFYEMLIYLWCMENFTEDDFEYVNKKYLKGQWGFKR